MHPEALDAEDTKLITLARAARARVGATEGAAVRDGDGRTYAAATVTLPSLSLTALQLAVASAVAAGASKFEAAAVVTDSSQVDDPSLAMVRDVTPGISVHLAGLDGIVRGTIPA